MTGQQLIDIIQRDGLQDFVLTAVFASPDGSEWGLSYGTFDIEPEPVDVGYSDKTVKLGLIKVQ